MSRVIVRLTAGLALVIGVACAATPGDGNITTEARPIAEPFSGLVAGGGVLVALTVSPGAAQAVEVVADANLQPKIDVRVFEGILVVDTDNIEPTAQPIVRVTADTMVSISSNKTPTTVLATGVTVGAGETFSVGASEGGVVEVSGTCTDLIAIATGESIVRASPLVCERGDLEVLGEALLEVHLTESARLRGAGKSTVRITGAPPMVEQNVTDEVTVIIE